MARAKIILILLVIPSLCWAQITVSGTVKDQNSGERLISANVVDLFSNQGTSTNAFGFFSLNLPLADSAFLRISYTGFESKTIRIAKNPDVSLDVNLVPGITIHEIEITGGNASGRINNSSISKLEIPIAQIQKIPSILGERDIIRAFQLMPGIQSGKEGSSGMFVRGGSHDQNLILLDDVSLYNVNHMGGFLSVFNPDVISSVDMYKGGFPARYGGRLSAILDVRMKDGNVNKTEGTYTIGILSSKFALEGPIQREKSSYLISVRRSLFDLFSRAYGVLNGSDLISGYYLLDGNMKLNFTVTKKDRLFFSAYAGQDKIFSRSRTNDIMDDDPFVTKATTSVRWGNQSAASRWNHIWNNKLFSNTVIGATRYSHSNSLQAKMIENKPLKILGSFDKEMKLGILDYLVKTDFEYFPESRHRINTGGGLYYHNYTPSIYKFKREGGGLEAIDTISSSDIKKAFEFNGYLQDEFSLGKFSFNLGMHLADFVVDNMQYPSIQPRVRFSYQLDNEMALKASYSRMVQYVHLLSNNDAGLPTDLWVPTTARIPPQKSDLCVLGWVREFGDNQVIELTIEGYFKRMKNLIAFGNGESFFTTGKSWEDKVVAGGIGTAYGMEFLLQKKNGATTGWIGYTISKNTRRFENLNRGKLFPYRYDRRHDFSIVINHQINEKWSFSGNWVFATGHAVTLAYDKFPIDVLDTEPGIGGSSFTDDAFIYDSRNNYRMPAYHRLDIGFHYLESGPRKTRTWSFELINAYNRKNPYYLFFDNDDNGNRQLYSFSLFPIIPSISCKRVF